MNKTATSKAAATAAATNLRQWFFNSDLAQLPRTDTAQKPIERTNVNSHPRERIPCRPPSFASRPHFLIPSGVQNRELFTSREPRKPLATRLSAPKQRNPFA